MDNRVIIFDTTLRDGEQALMRSLSLSQKLQIALALEKLGVDVIEAGFPISSPGDFQSVRSIAENVKNAIVCGLSRAVDKDIDTCYEALKVAKRFRIHTFIATSDLHIKDKLKKNFSEVVEMAKKAVKRARNYGDDVEFSCEDAGRTPIDNLCKMVESVIACGARTINIPDTVGYTLPFEFASIIEALFNRVPNIDKAIISVHCHNDLGMATGNSLSAVAKGARQIECAMNGLGERAGNCALEEVVMALKTRSHLFGGLYTNIKHEKIAKTSSLVAAVCNEPVSAHKPIVGSNAFSHSSGIHQDGVLKNRQTYEIITPQSIGVMENRLLMTARSGRAVIKSCLENLGYAPHTYSLDDVYARFLKLADEKGEVFDYDLEALMFLSQELEGQSAFELVNFQCLSGARDSICMACVELKIHGKIQRESASANGPVEAIFACIKRLSGIECELKRYSINAKGSGADAQGQVDIEVEFNNRRFYGRGLSTDIIESSTQAFVSVCNAIYKNQFVAEVKKGVGSAKNAKSSAAKSADAKNAKISGTKTSVKEKSSAKNTKNAKTPAAAKKSSKKPSKKS